MVQIALQLLKMGIEQNLKNRFGVDGLSLLGDVKKIANVQQLKRILHALSEVASAEDIKKLIQGVPPPPAG